VRRIAFAGVVVAVLAAGLAAVLLAAHPGATARAAGAATARVARARPRLILPPTGGSACYVGLPDCSLTPCVEFTAAASQSAVYLLPGVRQTQPVSPGRCRRASGATGGAVTVTPGVGRSAPARVEGLGPALHAAQNALGRLLAVRRH
jgi:hypothetical protein